MAITSQLHQLSQPPPLPPQPPSSLFKLETDSSSSFRGRFTTGSKSSPPSLKAGSLSKGKKNAMVMLPHLPSLLGRKRGATIGASTLKAFKDEGENCSDRRDSDVKQIIPTVQPLNLRSAVEKTTTQPIIKQEDDASHPTNESKNPLQRPRSKSRTIIRMLTTKFRSRSLSSRQDDSSNGRVPTAPSNQAAREAREAALRERGLLPPLRMNRDLSRLEKEQDRKIPVVSSPTGEVVIIDEKVLTAANLVKAEWEAKNLPSLPLVLDETGDQKHRMDSFRFGSGATSAASGPSFATSEQRSKTLPPPPVTNAINLDLASPALPRSGDVKPIRAYTSPFLPTPPALELNDRHLSMDSHIDTSISEDLAIPCAIPLPPSPLPSVYNAEGAIPSSDLGGLPSSLPLLSFATGDSFFAAASIPLPPSPQPNILRSPSSIRSFRSQSDLRSPSPSPQGPLPAIPASAPPTMPSFQPQSPSTSGIPPRSLTIDSLASPMNEKEELPTPLSIQSHLHFRTGSSDGDSSIATPSLDSSSRTYTTLASSLHTTALNNSFTFDSVSVASSPSSSSHANFHSNAGASVPTSPSIAQRRFGGNGKASAMQVRVFDHAGLSGSGKNNNNNSSANTNIPMIVESPSEEGGLEAKQIEGLKALTSANANGNARTASPALLEIPSTVDEEQILALPAITTTTSSSAASAGLRRGITDPTHWKPSMDGGARRKSINFFNSIRRGATVDNVNQHPSTTTATTTTNTSSDPQEEEEQQQRLLLPTPSSSPPTARRRLTVSSSLLNMRNSVVGSLSRPKSQTLLSPTRKSSGFDASRLPPSPKLQTQFYNGGATATATMGGRSPTSPTSPTMRRAVSPTLHSRGSILFETAKIENAESRELTEMAFLA